MGCIRYGNYERPYRILASEARGLHVYYVSFGVFMRRTRREGGLRRSRGEAPSGKNTAYRKGKNEVSIYISRVLRYISMGHRWSIIACVVMRMESPVSAPSKASLR